MKAKIILPKWTDDAPIHGETISRRWILVVDEDPDIRRLNAEALIGAGFQVDTAEDGAQAWDYLQFKNYDLLITDNIMPKITGVELLQKLNAIHGTMPVIMATGTMPSPPENQSEWPRLEAVLLKPYSLTELLEMAEIVLRAMAGFREQILHRARPASSALLSGKIFR